VDTKEEMIGEGGRGKTSQNAATRLPIRPPIPSLFTHTHGRIWARSPGRKIPRYARTPPQHTMRIRATTSRTSVPHARALR
jgi:hypothetical protein